MMAACDDEELSTLVERIQTVKCLHGLECRRMLRHVHTLLT